MTVAELIERLRAFPPDAVVMAEGDGCPFEMAADHVAVLDDGRVWFP